jgi:hypothetical protein
MQPTMPPISTQPIGRTDRPPSMPLSQLVAKVLNAPQPAAPAAATPAEPAKEQPPARTDGRNMRLGSFVDIRV